MKHSFVLLAFGESAYIEDCIKSLQEQSVKSDIYIATSTPSKFLEEVARKYRLEVRINGARQGISADWSFAYECAGTEYVTLAHQDDIYFPQYTERCLASAERAGDSLIVFSDYYLLRDGTRRRFTISQYVKRTMILPFLIKSCWRSSLVRKTILRFGNPVCCPSVMFNKGRIGRFSFSADFTYNLDWEAWVRLADYSGSFVFVGRPLVSHRIHRDSETFRQIHTKQRAAEERRCLELLLPGWFAAVYSRFYSLGALSNRPE